MRLLLLGRWVGRGGAGTREFQLARQLARHHRVTLAFTTDEPDPHAAIAALRGEFGDLEFSTVPRGWRSLSTAVRLASGESGTLAYFRSSALSARLAGRTRQTRFDAAYVSASCMIQHALELRDDLPLVMDFGELDSQWWLDRAARVGFPGGAFYRTEGTRLRMAETAVSRRATRCIVASPEAGRILESFAPWATGTVIPSGIGADRTDRPPRLGEAPVIAVLASPDHGGTAAVASLCAALGPALQATAPGARFAVRGLRSPASSGPAGDAEGCATDWRALLQRAAAVVVLSTAGEVRTRMLEAMASGVPVVATTASCDGLAVRRGREIEIADTTADQLCALVTLLADRPRRDELAAGGRAYVRAHHSWDVFGRRMLDVVAGVVQTGPAMPREGRRPLDDSAPRREAAPQETAHAYLDAVSTPALPAEQGGEDPSVPSPSIPVPQS